MLHAASTLTLLPLSTVPGAFGLLCHKVMGGEVVRWYCSDRGIVLEKSEFFGLGVATIDFGLPNSPYHTILPTQILCNAFIGTLCVVRTSNFGRRPPPKGNLAGRVMGETVTVKIFCQRLSFGR